MDTRTIFVSYPGIDGLPLADVAQLTFEKAGHRVWMFNHNRTSGERSWREIGNAILDADLLFYICTAASKAAEGQAEEASIAINNKRSVHVAAIDNAEIPVEVSGRNWDRVVASRFRRHCEDIALRIHDVISRGRRFKETEKAGTDELDAYLQVLSQQTIRLRDDRVEECRKTILESYLAETFPRQVAKIGRPTSHVGDGFRRIGLWQRIRLEDFNATDFWWDFFWRDTGRALVRGEKEFFLDTALQAAPASDHVISVTDPDFSVLRREIGRLAREGHNPNVLMAPIDLMVKFYKHFESEMDWPSGRPERITIPSVAKLRVYWSNRFLPLNTFLIFSSDASVWTVRPDRETGGAITIAVGESELYADEIELAVETKVKYEISTPEALCSIRLDGSNAKAKHRKNKESDN